MNATGLPAGFVPFAKLVRDALARQQRQPTLERTARRLATKLRHLLSHRDDRLLHRVLRFGFQWRNEAGRLKDMAARTLLLIQDYFDRWAIEVNHRDEKEILGVGQAQVWNEKSVCKVPALIVAIYS